MSGTINAKTAVTRALAEKTKMITELLDFISKLKAPPEGMNAEWLEDGLWNTLGYGTSAWNIFDEYDREELLEKGYFGGVSLERKQRIEKRIKKEVDRENKLHFGYLKECFDEILNTRADILPTIMSWFHDYNKLRLDSTGNRASLEALSRLDAASDVTIKDKMTLIADKIHYNMFNTPELKLQSFRRFKFPADFSVTEDDEEKRGEMIELYEALEEFMLCENSQALEPTTQKVFLVFMEVFLASFFPEFSAVPVTGMTAIMQPMTVTKAYLKNQDSAYDGPNKSVTLSIMSDLVICPRGILKQNPTKTDQQNYFLNCNVNIVMKRLRLLHGKRNNSPMTQVCAESMVRKPNQATKNAKPTKPSTKQFLFSILTDIVGIYVLCHDQGSNEYWISRQENDPTKIVDILLWLMRCATASSGDPNALRQFLTNNLCPEADKTARYDRDDWDTAPLGPNAGESHAPQGHLKQDGNFGEDYSKDQRTVMTFEELLPEEETWPEPDYFYAFQSQRLFGVNVKLTDDLILRHDVGSEMDPWPETTQYPRTFDDMEVDATAPQPCCSPIGAVGDTRLLDSSMLDLYESLDDIKCNVSVADMEVN